VTSGRFIGVDVGGTKVAIASLHGGRLSGRHEEPTARGDADTLVEQLVRLIGSTRAHDTRAVGVGVPSVIEFATGRIRNSVNVPLVDVPLRNLLTDRLGLPVYVDNDANCAALAEAYEDGRLRCGELVMLTVGTGVGSGLVLNGRLFRGATGAAPEIGHVTIGLDLTEGAPALQGWPRAGSLESLASGSALDRLTEDAARRHPESRLRETLDERGVVSGRDAVAAALAGDPVAIDVIAVLGERLGIGIANAINTFDPFEVVIGGGVSAAGEFLLGPARAAAARYTLPGMGTETKIRLARHGAEAGVLGAALIAAQEEEQH
jgi:glucokinase